MPTRNLVITDHQEAFIGGLVHCGRYKNASEVMRESLRLMESRELEESAKLDYLRRRLDVAEQESGDGHLYDYTPTLLDEIDVEEQNNIRQVIFGQPLSPRSGCNGAERRDDISS